MTTKKLQSFILTQLDDGSHLELCHPWFSHFVQKNFTHSFWLILMMASILNHCCLGFRPLLKKKFIHSFWLNLMMAAILNSVILDSAILHKTLTLTSSIWLKLINSDSTRWWQWSWILPCWIQPFCTKKNFTCSFSLKLMMAAIVNSAILDSATAILHSDTLVISSQIHWKHSSFTLTLSQTNSMWLNLMMAAILNSAILYSLPCCTKLWLNLIHSDSKSFILTQIDDGSHLEFCYLGFSHFAQKKNFTFSFWLNLMIAAILNSAMLDSDTAILDSKTLLSSLRFTQKHSPSTLTLTQTNSIWLT